MPACEWAPVRDLRFRGNYGRAVRAPNVSETGFPLVPNFAPGFNDPCKPGNIGQNPNRAANCAADLGALLSTWPSLDAIAADRQRHQPEPDRQRLRTPTRSAR